MATENQVSDDIGMKIIKLRLNIRGNSSTRFGQPYRDTISDAQELADRSPYGYRYTACLQTIESLGVKVECDTLKDVPSQRNKIQTV